MTGSMRQKSMVVAVGSVCVCAVLCIALGCSSKPKLMATPNIYALGYEQPFTDVPASAQNNKVEVLYLTDRAREEDTPAGAAYGSKRSRSVAFGAAEVEIGKDLSWDQIVEASTTEKRKVNTDLSITRVNEITEFPPTPRVLFEDEPTVTTQSAAATRSTSTVRMDVHESLEKCREEIRARLAQTNTKEICIFVHGYSVKFEGSLLTIAQVWHFLGREGVPIAYSWPAGSKGLVRGYTYDHDSSEFTVYHLKQALYFLAAMPEVKKVHVIAHSRGTGVAVSALRELHLEILGGGKVTRDELKLGTVVLAAPDLDLDMVIQRAATARLGLVPERSVIYVNSGDEALGVSAWLFGGKGRLGRVQSNMFTPEELARARNSDRFSIIDARVKNAGSFRHNYFYSNPAVSSDLILLLRYKKAPGAANGRPLRVDNDGFWMIDDSYPQPVDALKTD